MNPGRVDTKQADRMKAYWAGQLDRFQQLLEA